MRLGNIAVIAPRGTEFDHPDLVAIQYHIIEVVVVEMNDLSISELVRDVGIGKILGAVLAFAELSDLVISPLKVFSEDSSLFVEGNHLESG